MLHERYSSQHVSHCSFTVLMTYMTSHSERFASLATVTSVAAREVWGNVGVFSLAWCSLCTVSFCSTWNAAMPFSKAVGVFFYLSVQVMIFNQDGRPNR